MAVHWSSESTVANHQDLQANAMALDWRGQFVLLAGRRTVAVIDLDKPTEVARRISRFQQKYVVSAAEWNPTPFAGSQFVIAVGEKADIFSFQDGLLTSGRGLKAHTRNITDLNWHRSNPNLLTTCSVDTFIHIWDVREFRKPASSFSAVTGASQVKWNRLNSNLLATGHDCDIRIWDQRKTSQPLTYITAHLSKIHCIDWSPHQENYLVSSNDSTVKFFDIKQPKKSDTFINTQSPVWRARYTPFGDGIITVVVPPLRRGENSLLLWSAADKVSPVHTFVGHSDVVLEFDWRNVSSNGSSQLDFQLVSWSRDHSLRIWKIDPHLLKVCGHDLEEDEVSVEDSVELSDSDTIILGDGELGSNKTSLSDTAGRNITLERNLSDTKIDSSTEKYGYYLDLNQTSQPESHSSFLPIEESNEDRTSSSFFYSSTPANTSGSLASLQSSHNLQKEFASLNSLRENSRLNALEIITDEDKRTCQVNAKLGHIVALLSVTLPISYPRHSPPSFKLINGTNIDVASKAEIIKSLKQTAAQTLKKKNNCLEPCLKIFLAHIKSLYKCEERSSSIDGSGALNFYLHQLYGSQQDYSIPFPRTSGARFCSSGKLVCFTRPTVFFAGGIGAERDTPRSLSALRANVKTPIGCSDPTSPNYSYIYPAIGQSPSTEKDISVSDFYYNDRQKVRSKRGNKSEEDSVRIQRSGNVLIFDVSSMNPISKKIASAYTLSEDNIVETCNKNREAGAASGREDLVRLWSAAALIATNLKATEGQKDDFPMTYHPLGRKLIMSQIEKYLRCFDVQTAAMLSCVFGDKPQTTAVPWRTKHEHPGSGGSPYKTIHAINTESLVMSRVRHCRSNSEGSLVECSRPPLEVTIQEEMNTSHEKVKICLLDPSKTSELNEIRRSYADILYRWDLLDQRAMVTKHVQNTPSAHVGVDFQIECQRCGQSCRQPICHHCKKYSFICVICHLPVRGCSNFCIACGHGGHTYHIDDWFSTNYECPSGCGCHCLAEMEEIFR